ncbi:hypothetical protein [Vitreoscilla stercoraria]|uniref:DUF4304 domain-containing protein n=1 Tax=Vitreoscilla stercoraria TaxID=61 RepID=A0ABY4EF63_VITST|nr:hypothetical protein [Vitreoscilla stercoraria]UOO93348.1 hypothetical protein LVJ81_04790 [Vitreoscilla stercoraria]
MDIKEIEQHFPEQVAHHKMNILSDNGIVRHIDFRNPDNSNRHFAITTWPHHLAISGDMGTFVFNVYAQGGDPFRFFRAIWTPTCFGYWAEKLKAGHWKNYSSEKAVRAVMTYLSEFAEDGDLDFSKTSFESLEELEEHLQRYADSEHDFIHEVDSIVGIDMGLCDIFEICNSFDEADTYYIWCCLAIKWAIDQYDNPQEVEQEMA